MTRLAEEYRQRGRELSQQDGAETRSVAAELRRRADSLTEEASA